ncbi:MAG: hypothetical protein PHY85_10265 [Bacteroidales bacterium]|nr:hypothetical protein [Bacteroidales bacterium]
MAKTIEFKRRLRIDIIMKRSELHGLHLQEEKLDKEMTVGNIVVGNVTELSRKRTQIADEIQKTEGELANLKIKYESLI